jgi:putative oxidoreductase
MVNSFLPSNWTDALTVAATAAEILLGIGLILGIYPRLVSLASAGLLSLFAFSMTLSFGIKAPLNFSVFADAAASLLSGLKARMHPRKSTSYERHALQ